VGRSFLRYADAIVASSWGYAKSSPILSPFLQELDVVPMGVDVRRFDGKVADSGVPRENELMAFENRILFVGKLIHYKGLRYLLEAFSKLESREVCLMIVGDGSERAGLISMARRLCISDRALFLGSVPDTLLPSTYALADVVVLPSISRREAFEMVILEAMASGKPVVASSIPGVSDVVDHGKTGYLVPPGDPEKMTKAIDNLLQNPSNATKMGEEGRVTARLRYDWEKVYSSYSNIYEGNHSWSERGLASVTTVPQVVRVSSLPQRVKMHKVVDLSFVVFLGASSFVWCFSKRPDFLVFSFREATLRLSSVRAGLFNIRVEQKSTPRSSGSGSRKI
jgi:glycosyltransferase involved in cell wall biosynthesis